MPMPAHHFILNVKLRSAAVIVILMLFLAAAPLAAVADEAERYRLPPQEVVDILDAPPLPAVSIDPAQRHMLLVSRRSLPPIADLAAPMLRLAGARINPNTNAPHQPRTFTGITIKSIKSGEERPVALPEEPNVGMPSWSPDGSRFAFTITREDGVELWVAEVDRARARRLTGPALNAVSGPVFRWMPDSRTLLCGFVPDGRGEAPQRPAVPLGPVVQETSGRTAPVRTFQDLLQGAHDEALYEHYFTAQLAYVDSDTGGRRDIGSPAIYSRATPSPDGRFLLVSQRVRPFSYLVGHGAFPEVVEIWDAASGEVAREVARLPLRDDTPIQGVPVGPRGFTWQNSAGATLLWIEALDGGDPRNPAEHRDRVMALEPGMNGTPRELLPTQHRFNGFSWLEDPALVLVREFDRDRRWTRTWLHTLDQPDREPRLVWDRSVRDRYGDPGSPVTRRTDTGHSVVLLDNGSIYLTGSGATPEGDRPFLDRLNLETLETERLWSCEGERLESVVDLLSDDGTVILTSHESPTEPPNYFIVDLSSGERRQVTDFPDPAPQLRDVRRELVTYEREDGVVLSATLYLPADRRPGERLPLLVWAYPQEFSDPETAGQVSGSPYRFVRIGGSSHLFLLTQGYAIMDNATMPVIGDPETMNDTFIEQIVAGAKAAIDYAVARGVADGERAAVGGHSYGAFMTANLLAHSDLFRAGIARSGAFNRTLTPFGFQSERRTLWEAPESYARLSPFMHAHRIDEPILLIHGQMDNNAGTFPMQSERLYHAVKGHGGTARLVMLPFESHGYAARESVLHVLAEMIDWLDRHVKNCETDADAEPKSAQR
jgi:dipeptidyl aminopeptidase/acylaminoacyl peptidase